MECTSYESFWPGAKPEAYSSGEVRWSRTMDVFYLFHLCIWKK